MNERFKEVARMNEGNYIGCNPVHKNKGQLLTNYCNNTDLSVDLLNNQGRSILATIDNVIPSNFCKEITKNTDSHKLWAVDKGNCNLYVTDEEFSFKLWKVLKPVITDFFVTNNLTTQPFGFDVVRGQWQLHGLNETFQYNVFVANSHDIPHKDAQYCPNNDERSLLTLLVYLNDDFKGGESNFYFPKYNKCDKMSLDNDVTFSEEIENLCGLETGYTTFVVKPCIGKAVIYSQNVIHNSTDVEDNHKIVLKTEILVKHFDKEYGLAVLDSEKKDYFKCLQYPRQAQDLELSGRYFEAAKLFEKSLSIRYSYPMKLGKFKIDELNVNKVNNNSFPTLIWERIFDFLDGNDIRNVMKAFPILLSTQKAWELQRFRIAEESTKMPSFIPSIDIHKGSIMCFRFTDSAFFKKNEEDCIRVAAMYSFYLVGRKQSDKFYMVRYSTDTQEAYGISLKTLLENVFYRKPCCGVVYGVNQIDPKVKNFTMDLNASVDRSYMSMRHNAQFVGIPLGERMMVNIEWPQITDEDIAKAIKTDSESTLYEYEKWNKFVRSIWKENKNDQYRIAILHSIVKHMRLTQKIRKDILVYDDTYGSWQPLNIGSFPLVIKDILRYKKWQHFFKSGSESSILWLDTRLSLENKVILKANQNHSEALYYHPPCGIEDYEIPTAKELYKEKLAKICNEKPGVSAAIISTLASPLSIPQESMCFCRPAFEVGIGGQGFQLLEEFIENKCFNHLVFDFTSYSISIRKEGVQSAYTAALEEHCIFSNAVSSHFTVSELKNLSDVFNYTVDVISKQGEPIAMGQKLEKGEWCWAGYPECSCCNPDFKITSCHNLQEYAALNHVHINGGVDQETDEVVVWVAYGGLVAL